MENPHLRIFLACLACTILLLFRHGYTFGSGDQSEMLPYAKYLFDNTLYPSDFYIQSIASSVPNERYIFSWLLSYLGDYLEWGIFILHIIATMLLVLGLYRLAVKGLHHPNAQWLATLVPVMVFYGVNLGGNELYYNTFLPSYVAQVIGLWVFLYAMGGKILPMYVLLMLATYVHPLIGVQLWLLMTLSLIVMILLDNKKSLLIGLLIFNLLYFFSAGILIYKIKNGYDSGNPDSAVFFDIIRFRAPHHYLPHTFPLSHWLILAFPFYVGWRASDSIVKFVFRWIAIGLLVYIAGVYILKSPTPLSTQWFSTTVWVKTFSFLIFLSFVEIFMAKFKPKDYFLLQKLTSNTFFFNGLLVATVLSIILMTPQYRLLKEKPYELPFFNNENAEVRISQLAKEKTSQNALFLIPADLSEFRFWSERSSFIDYKATNHRQAAFQEWYDRIQKVYKISLADRLNGADLTALANQHFQNLKETDFLEFANNQHITHVLTFKNVLLTFPKIAENDKYVIYEIPHG
ncbi:MAG: hypothetical protein JNL70_15430 [Saprospiraceae bacterium]|nr:hypothetical protein [Saprospiraceae bacterium]